MLRREEELNILRQEALNLLIKRGDYENGILKLIESGSSKPHAYETAGHIAENKKDLQKALSYYQIANTYTSIIFSARIHEKMNNLELAALAYESAIPKANGTKPEIINKAVNIYKKLKKEDKVREISARYGLRGEFNPEIFLR